MTVPKSSGWLSVRVSGRSTVPFAVAGAVAVAVAASAGVAATKVAASAARPKLIRILIPHTQMIEDNKNAPALFTGVKGLWFCEN
jgi:hypothetical protein